MDIEDTLKEIAKLGTVRITVRCLGRGFQITGSHGGIGCPPKQFDLRCGPEKSLETLIQEAVDLQATTKAMQEEILRSYKSS